MSVAQALTENCFYFSCSSPSAPLAVLSGSRRTRINTGDFACCDARSVILHSAILATRSLPRQFVVAITSRFHTFSTTLEFPTAPQIYPTTARRFPAINRRNPLNLRHLSACRSARQEAAPLLRSNFEWSKNLLRSLSPWSDGTLLASPNKTPSLRPSAPEMPIRTGSAISTSICETLHRATASRRRMRRDRALVLGTRGEGRCYSLTAFSRPISPTFACVIRR